MAFSYEDYFASEKIDANIKSRIKRFAPLAEDFFCERNLSVTDENFTAFQEFCIAEKGIAKNSVLNGISALKKYYKWKTEKEKNNLSENNIVENETSENIIIDNNIGENNIVEDIANDNIISVKVKKEMKKISVNIEKKKFQQLQILAIKHDKNITDYITVAIDKILQEHKSELENITGIF